MQTVKYPPTEQTIRIRWAPATAGGLVAQLALLAGLAATVGLPAGGWLAGAGYATAGAVLLRRARRRPDANGWGPADTVTLARAVLAGGVLALAAAAVPAGPAAGSGGHLAIVALAAAALLLDAFDGPVARRTGTSSRFGARFDMETDAVLVLALSVAVAGMLGWWVLAVGLVRYAFAAAAWWWPWLARPLPARRSRKVVAATQGVVLLAAVTAVLPRWLATGALAGTLVLLAWSFGRDIWWLSRSRAGVADPAASQAHRWARRRVLGRIATVAAAALVLAALLLPDRPGQLTAAAVLRIPAEGLLAVALVLALPGRARRAAAALCGLLLGLLALAKLLDIGFSSVLARPFDPVLDWSLLGAAVGFLADATGRTGALLFAAAAVVVAVVVCALLMLAAVRLAGQVGRHRRRAAGAVAGLGAVWVVCALLGVHLAPGMPVAHHELDRVVQAGVSLGDRQEFLAELPVDAFAQTPGEQLLAGLRGKDVVLIYVESYGRSALEDPELGIHDVLADGQRRLGEAGFGARSAYLTAPTVGGSSWLSHATLRSGLRVDNPLRYRLLVDSDRLTLNAAFQRAGWRTVAVMPGLFEDWPEGDSFGYDRVYAADDLEYQGRRMNWGIIPDQYTLAAFERLERARPDRAPLMAEIPLLSSHGPWHPIPSLTDWRRVGDGSVFDQVPHASPRELWGDPAGARVAYRAALSYSVDTVVSYVAEYGDDNLVVIVLGDHQPSPVITGPDAGADVPVSIIARDPAVLTRAAGWGWQEGLRPGRQAPVRPMHTFRDQVLVGFG